MEEYNLLPTEVTGVCDWCGQEYDGNAVTPLLDSGEFCSEECTHKYRLSDQYEPLGQ